MFDKKKNNVNNLVYLLVNLQKCYALFPFQNKIYNEIELASQLYT